MPKQQSRKEKKTNQQIVKACLASFQKLNREELETLRLNINALLSDDWANKMIEEKKKIKG